MSTIEWAAFTFLCGFAIGISGGVVMLRRLVYRLLDGYQQASWPECSGNPADCPENDGHGCCKQHGSET